MFASRASRYGWYALTAGVVLVGGLFGYSIQVALDIRDFVKEITA